jgi:phosphoglycolate phosphatase
VSQNRFRAVLFDLDGTLLDSVPDLALAVDRMRVELGHAPAGEAQVRRWVGEGARRLVMKALADALRTDPESVPEPQLEQALTSFFHHYERCCAAQSQLYDGAASFLSLLQRQGLRLGLVTNKPARFMAPLLDQFGLAALLPVAIGGDSLVERKPHPLPLLTACEQLAVSPAETLMVGDSRSDVLAARAASMAVVCLAHGYNHGRPVACEQPDRVFAGFAELVAWWATGAAL